MFDSNVKKEIINQRKKEKPNFCVINPEMRC